MIVTTTIHGRGNSEYPWTRPIYYDVIYSLVLLVGAIIAMVVIVTVSKNAAQ